MDVPLIENTYQGMNFMEIYEKKDTTFVAIVFAAAMERVIFDTDNNSRYNGRQYIARISSTMFWSLPWDHEFM